MFQTLLSTVFEKLTHPTSRFCIKSHTIVFREMTYFRRTSGHSSKGTLAVTKKFSIARGITLPCISNSVFVRSFWPLFVRFFLSVLYSWLLGLVFVPLLLRDIGPHRELYLGRAVTGLGINPSVSYSGRPKNRLSDGRGRAAISTWVIKLLSPIRLPSVVTNPPTAIYGEASSSTSSGLSTGWWRLNTLRIQAYLPQVCYERRPHRINV